MKTKIIFLCLLSTLLVAAPAFAGGWLIYHDGPYTGKIVDAETGQPIEGAAVVGIWYVGEYGHAEAPILKFFAAKETKSEQNGDFVIPSVTDFHLWPLAKLFSPYFKVFKPGYSSYEKEFYTDKIGNVIQLRKLNTKEERLEALFDIDICGLNVDDMCVPKVKIINIINTIEAESKNLGIMN